MEFRERSLEASSLFLIAEMLECGRYSTTTGRKCHPDHVNRLRSVATRISLELEEARLRRDIEGVYAPTMLRAVSDDRTGSSNGIAADSDAVILKRYLELDRCLEP